MRAYAPHSATARIHPDLRERIVLLDLPPGSRLTEESLAREYEVSRTPIRTVLARLHSGGLVEQQHGAGAVVAPIDTRVLRDVWRVRLHITELLQDFLALPADPQIVGQLRTLQSRAATVASPRTFGVLYSRYHELLLELVTSATLRGIHDTLFQQTLRAWLSVLPRMDLAEELESVSEELDLSIELVQSAPAAELAAMWQHFIALRFDRFNEQLSRPQL